MKYMTKEWYKSMRKLWSMFSRKENALKKYQEEYEKTFKHCEPDFAKNFNFHDCKVVSCYKEENDLILNFDNSGGFTKINQLIFKDCVILQQDKPLKDALWLYDEIYKVDNGYEIHVLLVNEELIEFTVTVTDIELVN